MSEENVEIVRRLYEAYRAGDFERRFTTSTDVAARLNAWWSRAAEAAGAERDRRIYRRPRA